MAPAGPAAPAPHRTLLVVEPNYALRQTIVSALGHEGRRVLSAGRGDTALQSCDAHEGSIDLLVVDDTLPDMYGPALALRLRERYPGLTVLHMTAANTPRAAADHEICKPFTLDALADKVRAILLLI